MEKLTEMFRFRIAPKHRRALEVLAGKRSKSAMIRELIERAAKEKQHAKAA